VTGSYRHASIQYFPKRIQDLSAALEGGREWLAALFVAGGVTIFADFWCTWPSWSSAPPCQITYHLRPPVALGSWGDGVGRRWGIALGFWLPDRFINSCCKRLKLSKASDENCA
jgi:hypothetical protein